MEGTCGNRHAFADGSVARCDLSVGHGGELHVDVQFDRSWVDPRPGLGFARTNYDCDGPIVHVVSRRAVGIAFMRCGVQSALSDPSDGPSTCASCDAVAEADDQLILRVRREAPDACTTAEIGAAKIRIEDAKIRIENARLWTEINRLNLLINSPQTADFMEAVRVEAAHQVERWGSEHDAGKRPEDWVTLVVYLLGKASKAHFDGDRGKLLHHVITLAAVALNWHRNMTGESTEMRPGVGSAHGSADQALERLGALDVKSPTKTQERKSAENLQAVEGLDR
jgi:hypothetical protein